MDLRKAPDIDKRAIDAVVQRNPAATNVIIQQIQRRFLKGTLYTVAFDLPVDPPRPSPAFNNRVYVTRNSIDAYGTDEFLLQIVGATHSWSISETFASPEMISAIIATLVTIAVVAAFLLPYVGGHASPMPDWITSGWLLILGFYFGKASGRSD